MLFNSLAFAVFLPLVFGMYWLLARKPLRYQHAVLLLASYYFYGSWDPRFLVLIVLSSIADYVIGLKLESTDEQRYRKRWLAASLLINLGILGVFKYFDFFSSSFAALVSGLGFQVSPFTLNVILPVGISFYTFQTLSYTIDIYRRKLKPTQDALAFFTFVAFFPQLVAGPIERAANLLPQFSEQRRFSRLQATSGLELILWGLFKKVVIADHLALYADMVFADSGSFQGLAILLGALAFGIQIYCDFSGYSDIAIGTARLFGFELMLNFRTPYFATSIRDFWNRWHISLSTWFRDYVYISLGGNRTSRTRWRINILLTFLISGLWHGAGMTFVCWGLIHGMVYLVENAMHDIKGVKLKRGLRWGITFGVVQIAWIFFRAPTLGDAGTLIKGLSQGWAIQLSQPFQFFSEFGMASKAIIPGFWLLISLLIWALLEWKMRDRTFSELLRPLARPLRWGIYYGLIIWLLIFGAFDEPQTFIYFQF